MNRKEMKEKILADNHKNLKDWEIELLLNHVEKTIHQGQKHLEDCMRTGAPLLEARYLSRINGLQKQLSTVVRESVSGDNELERVMKAIYFDAKQYGKIDKNNEKNVINITSQDFFEDLPSNFDPIKEVTNMSYDEDTLFAMSSGDFKAVKTTPFFINSIGKEKENDEVQEPSIDSDEVGEDLLEEVQRGLELISIMDKRSKGDGR